MGRCFEGQLRIHGVSYLVGNTPGRRGRGGGVCLETRLRWRQPLQHLFTQAINVSEVMLTAV
jgi:hypothetical protein